MTKFSNRKRELFATQGLSRRDASVLYLHPVFPSRLLAPSYRTLGPLKYVVELVGRVNRCVVTCQYRSQYINRLENCCSPHTCPYFHSFPAFPCSPLPPTPTKYHSAFNGAAVATPAKS
ncbi:unnamed protein product, partial [Ectocarpus fasciculatus]